jgi:hypothetical protein
MSLEIFSFTILVSSLVPQYTTQATTTTQKYPYPSGTSPKDNRTTGNIVSLLEANGQLITQMANYLECMEATITAGQATSQNCIA